MAAWLARSLLLAAFLCCVRAAVVVSLDKENWSLTNKNGSISLDKISVPAYPLEVLRARGIIEDPNWRYGELESRWVALDAWTFALDFPSSGPKMGELLASKEVVLQLGGIDTFATVTLNGQQLLMPNNFHRSWAAPVKALLRPERGVNTLVVAIRPATQESTQLRASHPYTIPALAQMGSIGSYIFARKPASDFGWDWGPAYAPSGIHGSIRLLGYDTATLSSAYVAQHKVAAKDGKEAFQLDVTSQLLLPAGGDEGTLVVDIPGLGVTHRQPLSLPDKPGFSSGDGVSVKGGPGGLRTASVATSLTVDAAAVKLWWPVGYGEQPLYDVHVAFLPASAAAACGGGARPANGLHRRLLGAADGAAGSGDNKAKRAPVAVDAAAGDAADAADAACQAASRHFTTLARRLGFRTVELVRLPIHAAVKDLFPPGEAGWNVDARFHQQKDNGDGHWAMDQATGAWQHFGRSDDQSGIEGESFYFKVNGLPIYMKGANYIPSHIIHTNATAEMLTDTLQYAIDSNMNMIRVWGGGRYPVEHLFEEADRMGLLIWMETMFACSPYPRDPAFLDNVAAEVAQQVQRLSWHPSVVIWGGNNEIEGSLNWYAESRSNRPLFANDYQALFIDTIRKGIREVNPYLPFVDSSPSNGVIADNDREYVKRWGDDWDWRYGDVHWYAYESDCEDWSTYPKAKFISEFGSQSYPTFATYAEATAPEDWQVDNPMTGFRNRRFGNGLEVFEAQFKRHFRLPARWSIPNDDAKSYKLFRSFLYITHMQQARCYEAAINYWRRLRSQPAGMTMGVLYWQLNDNSHFASWSSYDYAGRWKPLAYSVKRMYAPLQVQAITDAAADAVKVFLVNDHTAPVAASITVELLSMADTAAGARACAATKKAAASASIAVNFTVPPGFASEAWSMPIEALLARRAGCARDSCYVSVTAVGAPGSRAGAGEVSEAQLWLVPLKDINFPDPGLKVSGFAQQTVVASEPNYYAGDAEAMAAATNGYEADAAGDGGGAAAATTQAAAPTGSDAADEASLVPVASEQEEQQEAAVEPAQHSAIRESGSRAQGGAAYRSRLWTTATGKHLPAPAQTGAAVPGPKAPAKARRAAAPITFTLSASRPAALTTLVTKYRGRFSDDAFTALHPCAPRTITFIPHASEAGLTAEALAADLEAESLFDHQYGEADKSAPKAPHRPAAKRPGAPPQGGQAAPKAPAAAGARPRAAAGAAPSGGTKQPEAPVHGGSETKKQQPAAEQPAAAAAPSTKAGLPAAQAAKPAAAAQQPQRVSDTVASLKPVAMKRQQVASRQV